MPLGYDPITRLNTLLDNETVIKITNDVDSSALAFDTNMSVVQFHTFDASVANATTLDLTKVLWEAGKRVVLINWAAQAPSTRIRVQPGRQINAVTNGYLSIQAGRRTILEASPEPNKWYALSPVAIDTWSAA